MGSNANPIMASSPFNCNARNALDRRRLREAFSVDENEVGWYRKSLELHGSPPPPPPPEVAPAPGEVVPSTEPIKRQLTNAEKRIVVARWIAAMRDLAQAEEAEEAEAQRLSE